MPIMDQISAVSCGIVGGEALLDLNYQEDSSAQVDANFVITGQGKLVEIQAAAEKDPFSEGEFSELLKLARVGTEELNHLQRQALKLD